MTNIIYEIEPNFFNFATKSKLSNEYYNIIIKFIVEKSSISIIASQKENSLNNNKIINNIDLFKSEFAYQDFKEYRKKGYLFDSCDNIFDIFNKLKNLIIGKDIVQIILNEINNEELNLKINLIKNQKKDKGNLDSIEVNKDYIFILKKIEENKINNQNNILEKQELENKENINSIITTENINNIITTENILNQDNIINEINKDKNDEEEDELSFIDKELNSQKNVENRYPELIKNLLGKEKEKKIFKSDISNDDSGHGETIKNISINSNNQIFLNIKGINNNLNKKKCRKKK